MEKSWFENLQDKLDYFFENATESEWNAAFEKAGYDYYKDVETLVFSDITCSRVEVSVSFCKPSKRQESIPTSEFKTADNYFTFQLAA